MLRMLLSLVLVVTVAAGGLWILRDEGDSGGFELWLQPDALDFGRVPAGTLQERFLIMTNSGDETIQIDRVAVPEGFHASRDAVTLPAGSAKELIVTFRAIETGQREGTLRLEGTQFGRRDVALRADVGVPPEIRVEPSRISFGQVSIDGTASGLLTFHNDGADRLEIQSLAIGPPFDPEVASLSVEPGEKQSVEVRFSPTAQQRYRSSLTIRSNDPNRPVLAVGMAGEGIDGTVQPVLSLNPAALDFGEVNVGSNQRKWISVRNLGSDPLTINAVGLESPFRGGGVTRTIAPNGNYRFPVSFSPTDQGAHLVPFLIYSNDPDLGVSTVSLLGNAVGEKRAARGKNETDTASTGRGLQFPTLRGLPEGSQPDSAPQQLAAEGAGEDALDDSASDDYFDDEFGDDTAADEQVAQVAGFVPDDGTKVCLGTFCSNLTADNVPVVEFDGDTGRLVMELSLPDVDQALGEAFTFSEARAEATVGADGHVEIVFEMVIEDMQGNVTTLKMPLTTGEVVTPFGNTYTVREGVPTALGDPTITLQGGGLVPDGKLRNQAWQVADVQLGLGAEGLEFLAKQLAGGVN